MRSERGRWRPLLISFGLLATGGAILHVARRLLDVVEVEGRSMAPALLPGDRLLVESLTFRWRGPRVGEVVLARDPRRPQRELVKRVHAAAADLDLRGDAPELSTDSRVFGAIPASTVRWRVVLRYWPLRRVARLAGSNATRRA